MILIKRRFTTLNKFSLLPFYFQDTQLQYAQLYLPASSKAMPKKEDINYAQVVGVMKPKRK